MDKNMADLIETVNFIKDYMVNKMVTKEEHDRLEQKVDDGFMSLTSRIGGLENRIDEESARRTDLETRVRSVLPTLPPTPERV